MKRHLQLIPLSHQHHDVLALCVLVERALGADSSEGNLARQAAKAVYFATTEGENHFQIEEQILFPLVEDRLGGHPLLATLREEHAELRAMAGRLASQPLRADLDAFVLLLRQHVRKEEREFFEDVQVRLPAAALEAVGKAMRERVLQICVTG